MGGICAKVGNGKLSEESNADERSLVGTEGGPGI